MDFKAWLESREYQGEEPGDMAPLTPDDEWKVYHGINNFRDAINVALYGISGKDRVVRNYSFEQNNNPYGVFVTIDFKTAKKFAYGSPKCIIEFYAHIKDLEAPVWPSGRYTVQGEMPQSFNSRHDRYKARLKAHIDAAYMELPKHPRDRKEVEAIRKSYYPSLARTMFGGERQALFVGHLNPNEIKFWVSLNHEDYQPISRQEFLTKYADKADKESGHQFKYRMFEPRDDFDPNKFIEAIKREFGQHAADNLQYLWQHSIARWGNMGELEKYVWPKQLPGLVKYLHRRFGGSPRSERKKEPSSRN